MDGWLDENNVTNVSNEYPHYDDTDKIFQESLTDGAPTEDTTYIDKYLILLYDGIRRKLLIIFMSVFLVFSLLVDSLCFVVLCRHAFLMNIYAFGQRFLCVLDIAFSLVVTFGYLIQGLIDNDLSDWSPTVCTGYRTSAFILAAVSNWTLVYLSIVRYIGIKVPLKLHSNPYLKGAYSLLVVISFANSLFYVTFYLHLPSFIVVKDATKDTDGFCWEYDVNQVNMYAFRFFLMLPDTILPGIFIIILNAKIYSSFADLAQQATLLKRKLNNQSLLISKLRRSLNKDDLVAKQSLEETDEEDRVSISLSEVSTVSMTKNYTKFFNRTMKRLSSTKSTKQTENLQGSDTHLSRRESKRIRIAKKLLLEKQNFRRATITYGLLCAGVIPEEKTRKKSFRETKAVVESNTSRVKATNVYFICQPCVSLASPFARKLIIVGTVSYIVLNAPYCIWFIFSDAMFSHKKIDLAVNRLVSAIVGILKCGFHTSNVVVYILSSNKVRSEVDALINKLRGRQ